MKAFNSISMIADGAPGERKALDYAVDLAVRQQTIFRDARSVTGWIYEASKPIRFPCSTELP